MLSTTCSSPCVNSFSPVSGITSCVLLQVQGANYWCAGSAVSSYLTVSLISADPNAFGSGLRLTYINGQSGCGTGRKTVFNLNCDQTKTVTWLKNYLFTLY